ncbi:MAG: hypothetical protein RR232_04070 [Clostridia bacterium]
MERRFKNIIMVLVLTALLLVMAIVYFAMFTDDKNPSAGARFVMCEVAYARR